MSPVDIAWVATLCAAGAGVLLLLAAALTSALVDEDLGAVGGCLGVLLLGLAVVGACVAGVLSVAS